MDITALPRTCVRVLAAGLLGAFAAWPLARAAALEVTVTGADGRPAPDTVVMVVAPGAPAPFGATVQTVIEQREFRFEPYVSAVPVGTSVRFVNEDRVDHHIRTLPGGPLGNVAPAKSFELRLAAARKSGDTSGSIRFEAPGSILLGCHLHASMRGHIYVAPTPWVAVTDARGRARIDRAPEGAAELKLWHPDQLAEQPPLAVQLGPSAGATEARLNFSPRGRPAARRPAPSYPAGGEYR